MSALVSAVLNFFLYDFWFLSCSIVLFPFPPMSYYFIHIYIVIHYKYIKCFTQINLSIPSLSIACDQFCDHFRAALKLLLQLVVISPLINVCYCWHSAENFFIPNLVLFHILMGQKSDKLVPCSNKSHQIIVISKNAFS